MTSTRLILPLLLLTANLSPADDGGLPPGAISPEEAYTPEQQAQRTLKQLTELYGSLADLLAQVTDEKAAQKLMDDIARLHSQLHALDNHLKANPDLRQAVDTQLKQSPELLPLLREQEARYLQEIERCRQAGLLPENFHP